MCFGSRGATRRSGSLVGAAAPETSPAGLIAESPPVAPQVSYSWGFRGGLLQESNRWRSRCHPEGIERFPRRNPQSLLGRPVGGPQPTTPKPQAQRPGVLFPGSLSSKGCGRVRLRLRRVKVKCVGGRQAPHLSSGFQCLLCWGRECKQASYSHSSLVTALLADDQPKARLHQRRPGF